MDENARARAAREYFLSGYNCTQAVALAFEDMIDADRDTLLKICSSFGGGMGRLREVCGAVSAMFIVMGLISGYATPETGEIKTNHYKHIQALAARFEAENGSIVCRELLGLGEGHDSYIPTPRTPEYYKSRPCPDKVASAAKILDEYLREYYEQA